MTKSGNNVLMYVSKCYYNAAAIECNRPLNN